MPSSAFNDTATTEIYTLSLHDALPIYGRRLGLHRHRFSPGPPSRRPGEARAPNTDRPSPEGKNALTGRHQAQPGGIDENLRYSTIGAECATSIAETAQATCVPTPAHIGICCGPMCPHFLKEG